MRQTVTFGRLFDIRVGVHASWLVIYVFVTIALAGTLTDIARGAAFGLAAGCALLVFASVIAHEFAHALVARAYRVRTTAITLFLFGGVATLECEPPSPRAEAMIALAGPALSASIAALAFAGLMLFERLAGGPFGHAIGALIAYFAFANGALAAFNLIPAFPMDGGRVLRAAVWQLRKSRAAATGAASIVGLVFAAGLVIVGAVFVVAAHAWGAGWYVMIGAFIMRQSWQQLRDSRAFERLEGACVRDAMAAAGGNEWIGRAAIGR